MKETMRCSEQGIALIREFEGFCASAYRCPAGKWTIGYGHVIRAGESYLSFIDEEKALALLRLDIELAEQAICRLVKPQLGQHQFDALVSFVYNVGIGAFSGSTLLKLLNLRDFAGASGQFARWVWVLGARSPGLTRRRSAETLLFSQKP